MSRPLKRGLGLIFLGLLPLGLLFIGAITTGQAGMERDLATRGAASAGGGWAKLAVEGRDAVLAGEAPSPEARERALAGVAGTSGIRRVSNRMTVLPEAKPFVFTAMRDGAKVSLTGAIPPGAAGDALKEAAAKALPGIGIVNELKPARGAPDGFVDLAAFGLAGLAGLDQGTLTLSDRSLSLTGRALDARRYSEIRARLASLPAGAALAKGLAPGDILPPLAKPFRFAVERGAGGITLSGVVPSEAARDALAAAARSLGGAITDALQLADGAPAGDWSAAASLLVRTFRKLETGKATLTDDKIVISGKGAGAVTEEDIRADLRALPPGFTLASAAIESRAIRPYTFGATRGEGVLTLSGYVPDEKTRAEILDLVRRYFEGDRIEDRLAEGLGEPKDFATIVKAGLQALSRLAPGGALTLSDGAAALKGLALFDAARDEIAAEFRRLMPQGFQGGVDIATAPPPPPIESPSECQVLYKDALARGTIRFRSGAADLSDESRGLLDRLAWVTFRCVNARVEIGGHTDTDGNPQSNAELSRRRAEAVAGYLVRAGVGVDRLEAVGYGQTVPVAPNDTAENKAKNRRIEFLVK